MKFVGLTFWLAVLLANGGSAFVPHMKVTQSRLVSPPLTAASVASTNNGPALDVNFSIPADKVRFPILKIGKGAKRKVMNINGLWCIIVSLIISPVWILAMTILGLYGRANKKWDPNRSMIDRTGKIWGNAWLALNFSYPTKSGNINQLKGKGIGPCLYMANHSAWIDIALVCSVIDTVFKFLAKGSLRKVPGIGQQLVGGKHILIDREDRKSQLKTFKEGLSWLNKGVPIMAFPEGTRSKNGRLMDFKGGMFSMAIKAGVPVVPMSICNAHAVWPSYAVLPIQCGRKKLHVHVHDAIESKGRTEEELSELVRAAILSKLPESQQPLPKMNASTEPQEVA